MWKFQNNWVKTGNIETSPFFRSLWLSTRFPGDQKTEKVNTGKDKKRILADKSNVDLKYTLRLKILKMYHKKIKHELQVRQFQIPLYHLN
jgi:hypothetical protein